MCPGPKTKKKNPAIKNSETKITLRRKAEDALLKKTKGRKIRTPEEIQSLIHELEVHQIELEMQNEELRHAQQALLQSRDLYADLYDYAPVGYITINDKGLVLKANLAVAELLGTERGKLLRKRFSQFIFDDDQDIYYKFRQSLSDSQDRLSCEVRMIRAGDRQFWVKLDSVPIQKIDDDSFYFRIAITDITGLKQAEEKLRTNDDRFNHVLKLMKNGLGVYRAVDDGDDFIVIYSYGTELSKLDKTRKNLTGKRLLDVFPEVKSLGLLDVFKRVWQTGEPENYPVAKYDGEDITGWRDNYVYKIPTGEIIAIYEDITEKKKMEMAVLESEHLFRSTFETCPDPININRLKDGKFIAVNPRFLGLLGYEESDVIGKTALDIKVWHNLSKRKDFFDILLENGTVTDFEAKFIRKDGSPLIAQTSSKVMMYRNEPHLIAITHDITDLKCAENKLKSAHQKLKEMYTLKSGELKESEIKYSTLLEALLTGVHITEKEKIVFTNKQFAKIFGYEKSELLNKNILDIFHPEDRKKAKKILHGKALENDEFEIRGMKKNGNTIYLLGINTVVEYEGREAILGNILDITRRKESEKDKQELNKELNILSSKLLTSEEIERKRIAREIHDSIGQALSAIKFSVENSLTLIENGSISSAQHALENIVPLTQQTIDEVRKIIMDLRPSILDDLGLKATISWFCREFGNIYSDIHIETEIYVEETDIPEQMKTIIYRILQEAFNNAAKHSKTKHINLKLEKNRDRLELLVEDKGCGFLVARVLAGTVDKRGMGLASMRERASLSGGDFSLSSTPGVGTEIKVSWPQPTIY